MATDLRPIHDVSTLQRGDRLDVHQFGYPTYSGTVLATMPKFKVVWIQHCTPGDRRMLCVEDCQLRHPR